MASGEMKRTPIIVDDLTSDSATDALSAKQGKYLNASKIRTDSYYGLGIGWMSLQASPPTGAKARLFVHGSNNKTYFIDLPYEA